MRYLIRYPLQWPYGWPRTTTPREDAFKVDLNRAVQDLGAEVERLGGEDLYLSTMREVRAGGGWRSDRRDPSDQGAAITFTRAGKPKHIGCDEFTTIKANVRALGLSIQALRSLERYGATAMLERAMSAFDALPPPPSCWEVLGIALGSDRAAIIAAFKAKAAHTGAGGNVDMDRLVRARDEALGKAPRP